jgi:flagellar biogenesis protein FliO
MPSTSNSEHLLLIALVVLALLVVGLLALRFFRSVKQRRSGMLRLVAELPVGRRGRVAVVQVGQKFMVVGITSTQVTRLGEYDSTPSVGSAPTSPFGVDLVGGRHPPGVN